MSGIINSVGSKSGILGRSPNEPAFHYENSDTTLVSASYTLINFSTLKFDTGSHYVTATDRFLPTDGVSRRYFIYAQIALESAALLDPVILAIHFNDVITNGSYYRGRNPASGYRSFYTSKVFTLNGSTDFVSVKVYNDDGTPDLRNAVNMNFFGGFAIS